MTQIRQLTSFVFGLLSFDHIENIKMISIDSYAKNKIKPFFMCKYIELLRICELRQPFNKVPIAD